MPAVYLIALRRRDDEGRQSFLALSGFIGAVCSLRDSGKPVAAAATYVRATVLTERSERS